jgi:hypothetical protein
MRMATLFQDIVKMKNILLKGRIGILREEEYMNLHQGILLGIIYYSMMTTR